MRFFVILFVLIILPISAGTKRLGPKDIAKLANVSDLRVSPDGTYTAYVKAQPRALFKEDDGKFWFQLYLWDEERGSRPFVAGKNRVFSIDWEPDGRHISFLEKRKRDKKVALYKIPVDGGEAIRVLSHVTDVRRYDWAPDGKRLLFSAREEKDKEREKLRKKGFTQNVFEEDDSKNLLWIVELGGEEPKKEEIKLEGSVTEVSWSPNGEYIAVALAPSSRIDDVYMNQTIHILDADSKALVMEIDPPGKMGAFRWSPDSKRVALIAAADRHDPSPGRLYMATLKGKKLRKYLLEEEGDVSAIAWANANTLYYLWDEGVEVSLRAFEPGKGKSMELLKKGIAAFTKLSVADQGGTTMLVGSTASIPPEVFRVDLKKRAAGQVTASNPWLGEYKLAPQEVVTFKARDGLKLEGILIRPLEEVQGKRYPLILTVHGGPEAHIQNGWVTTYSNLGQMAAARGFAVFYPNYRASTGRGVAFSKLDQGRPAMEEFNDLVDASVYLADTVGLVDKSKVGITGASYGGYASAWCATALTEHFAAAVMSVGITNKISKYGASDIPVETHEVHDLKYIWEDWDLFLKQSPIYHVQKARTPLLIMHGQKDKRVPPSQSVELFRALKTIGKVPVRLVRYPKEAHGNKRAAARYDFNLRALRWFQHFLQDGGKEKPKRAIDYGMPSDDGDK